MVSRLDPSALGWPQGLQEGRRWAGQVVQNKASPANSSGTLRAAVSYPPPPHSDRNLAISAQSLLGSAPLVPAPKTGWVCENWRCDMENRCVCLRDVANQQGSPLPPLRPETGELERALVPDWQLQSAHTTASIASGARQVESHPRWSFAQNLLAVRRGEESPIASWHVELAGSCVCGAIREQLGEQHVLRCKARPPTVG